MLSCSRSCVRSYSPNRLMYPPTPKANGAPHRPEMAVCQQEPGSARGAAHAMRCIHDGPGEVEGPLAFGAAEERRAAVMGLFGRIQDAHSGHEGIRCWELQGNRSFSLRVKYDDCR